MSNSTLQKINNIDMDILRFINRKISNKTLNIILPPFTNKYKFHYLAEILGLYIYLKTTKKSGLFNKSFLTILEVFTASILIKFIIKHKRPYVNYKDIIDRDDDIPNVGAEEFKIDNEIIKNNRNSWYSFPSTEAATSAVFLKLLLKPGITIHNIVLITYCCTVLFSRMYNGMHRPVDILFGSLLGWFWPNNFRKD